jgi:hypothetical protein
LRLWRWLTACVVVAVLWPSAARLFAAVQSGDAPWVSVCSGDGLRWVRLQTAPDDPAPSHESTGAACAWCAQSQLAMAAPPAVEVDVVLAVYRPVENRPARASLPGRPPCDAVGAEPRAPPLRT